MKHKYHLSRLGMLGALLAGGVVVNGCLWGTTDVTCNDLVSCAGRSGAGSSGESGTSPGNSGSSGTSGGDSGTAGMSSSGAGGASGRGGAPNGGRSGAAGAVGDSGAAGEVTPPCDTTKSPTEESCLVSNDYAVFVAPNGQDTAGGTMKAPVATLSKAIELAGAKFVIVCDATYNEHVVFSTGAQVYGGFKCAGGTWATEAGAPLFKPTDPGPALKIDGVVKDILISTVNFEVPDAIQPGASAVTAFVNASPKVKLSNVTLTAGAGMKGADGTLQLFNYSPQASLNGNPEKVGAVDNGTEKVCACQPPLMSVGGGGGPPSSSGQSGARGLPDHGGGAGGDPSFADCSAGSGGKKGGDAAASTPSGGAAILGSIVPAGWLPASGFDGVTGSPGQGGGGGASLNNQGHGGGGGCGGCGGNGGPGGAGGGGSIALLVANSPVVIEGSRLIAADAGDGGNGVTGQQGQQQVGNGGNSIASTISCGGGSGGKGGNGGAGGGGAGGVSVGVVWKGATAPTLTGTTTKTGKAGAMGIGGVPGTNDGIAGVKQDVLQVP